MSAGEKTRPVQWFLVSGVLAIGLGFLFTAWTGIQQLSTLAGSADNSVSLADFPLLKTVWEAVTPSNGQIAPAKAASRVAKIFLGIGALGFIVTAACLASVIYSIGASKTPDTNDD